MSTPSPDTAPLLRVEQLTKRFGDQIANDHVDLAVSSGEVVGLLGANGAGKTTLIRQALGLLQPDEGRITLAGGAPSRATRRASGYMPQGLGLWTDLTARENLRFVARAYGRPDVSLDSDLSESADVLVRELDLGTRRKVAFAAALQHEPRVLVLDEPTSGVDALERSRLWDRIRDQADRGTAVLVSTHSMDEAEQCDRVVILDRGAVKASGTVSEIIGDEQVVEVETEAWSGAFGILEQKGLGVGLVGRRLRVQGASVDEVRRIVETAGIEASAREVPSSLEETMVQIIERSSGL